MKSIRWMAVMVIMALVTGCALRKEPVLKEMYIDDFTSFNSAFWVKADHTFTNNQAVFTSDNAFILDRKLLLTITDIPRKDKKFSAAELRSIKSFKYGKFTVRMKAAQNEGVVSAFFLYSTKSKINQEIDIEFTGKNTSLIHLNHWTGAESNVKTIPLDFDAASGFHNYSITWLPDEIIWEADGKILHKVQNHIPQAPLKLMMNLWPSVENDWTGHFSAHALPAQVSIEYVKVYSLY